MQLRRLAVLAAMCASACLAACSSGGGASGKSIAIGIDLPLSGADASVGRSTLNGMLLAIDQAAKRGVPAP